MNELLRHITACNTARLPGERVVFRIGSSTVGWVKPDLARALAQCPAISTTSDTVTLAPGAAGTLPDIARTLTTQGFGRWRNEAFDVRATPDGPALTTIDRCALPAFGIQATGVHLNGLVHRPARLPVNGLHIWVARRAADKALDPGKLDHLVAGGVPAGMTPYQTLIKEAAEEAAIPAPLAAQATHQAIITYAMERPEGLRRDHLHCYDLTLPEFFTPHANDGEVESFELLPATDVLHLIRTTDRFKFNVNLVLIDLFLRLAMIPTPEATSLRLALGG